MLKRPLNVGFSGGEKKRMEMLQMAVLEPSLCVLDETDFGSRHRCDPHGVGGANALRWTDRAMLVITHYQRLLEHIVPDKVHVLARRTHPQVGRQGAGARARQGRLCGFPIQRGRSRGPRQSARRSDACKVTR